ncbi:MAG: patatin-like phospholipase family protein [Pseudomonadota bacterium]
MKVCNFRYLAALAASALCASVIGCGSISPDNDAPQLTPRFPSDVQASVARLDGAAHRPIVGLVLGGGGLRGFAHVGVLRALEEAGIRPDIVVGTSAGAVVGAAYASGKSWSQVDEAARGVKLSSLLDLTFSTGGVMRGDNLARWVDSVTGGVPIEGFPVRFAAVATDLQSQRAVVLDRGTAGRAVQASAAVPGINVPVAYPGGHLVDGGASSLVPVRVARAMGADIVIAVDIYCNEPPSGGLAAPAVIFSVMHSQSCRIAESEMAEADVLIAPSIGTLKMSEKLQHQRAMEAGYLAAREKLPMVSARVATFRIASSL